MKIFVINHSDIYGGAARAAYRIHHALLQQAHVSRMHVNLAISDDWTVQGPETRWAKLSAFIRPRIGSLGLRLLNTDNLIIHSPSILPSHWTKRLNQSDADVLHLHWVNEEMMSIADIGKLRKPIVWTLHDMWAFSGAEHYTEEYRWREGYRINNRPLYESGFDVNLWTWKRKRTYWRRPMQIVTPSTWLANCVRQSSLMCDWPVSVVANPLNTDFWKPIDKCTAREILQLPSHVPIVLFGALAGGNDPRKGFDLLTKALHCLDGQLPEMEIVVFGQLAPKEPPNLGFPTHYSGHLHDDISLRLLYSAADVLVVPSRQESFGLTASEAHACGTPVVAFDNTGLADIVGHKATGYLAKAFEVEDLAYGIRWVLMQNAKLRLGENAREKAVADYSYPVIAEKYLKLYQNAIEVAHN